MIQNQSVTSGTLPSFSSVVSLIGCCVSSLIGCQSRLRLFTASWMSGQHFDLAAIGDEQSGAASSLRSIAPTSRPSGRPCSTCACREDPLLLLVDEFVRIVGVDVDLLD